MNSDQSKPQTAPEQKKSNIDSTQSSISKKTESITPEFEGSLTNQLVTRFGDKIVKVIYVRPGRTKILVPPNEIQIEVIYHLSSYSDEKLSSQILALSTRVDRNQSTIPTLIDIFKSAEYHERETFEMLGVYFEGHPRNERFLLPEDWADLPPLRKEFRIRGR